MRLAKRRQSEKVAKRVSCHALRRYTLHVVQRLSRTSKASWARLTRCPETWQARRWPNSPFSTTPGSPWRTEWWWIGRMDDFPGIVDWSGLNIVDAEGRWVLPAWCDSHTHTVFAREPQRGVPHAARRGDLPRDCRARRRHPQFRQGPAGHGRRRAFRRRAEARAPRHCSRRRVPWRSNRGTA